jgi:isopentenyl diphosphate isomerase/L-lactate dehydrogenase-like FMN-dependent dehydrogenase
MGRTVAKIAPAMENEDEQNSISTVGICEAANDCDCAETNTTSTNHRSRSRRATEQATASGVSALWFDNRCAL